jgi:hypothetical protein
MAISVKRSKPRIARGGGGATRNNTSFSLPLPHTKSRRGGRGAAFRLSCVVPFAPWTSRKASAPDLSRNAEGAEGGGFMNEESKKAGKCRESESTGVLLTNNQSFLLPLPRTKRRRGAAFRSSNTHSRPWRTAIRHEKTFIGLVVQQHVRRKAAIGPAIAGSIPLWSWNPRRFILAPCLDRRPYPDSRQHLPRRLPWKARWTRNTEAFICADLRYPRFLSFNRGAAGGGTAIPNGRCRVRPNAA